MTRRDYRIRWPVVGVFVGAMFIAILVGRFISTTAASVIVVGALVVFALIGLLRYRDNAIGLPVDGLFVGGAHDHGMDSDMGDVGGDTGVDFGGFGGDFGGGDGGG